MLTTDEFRDFETTTIGDESLQVLLDAAEAEIVRFAGAPEAAVEWFDGGQRFIFLRRPAASVTSIVEGPSWYSAPITLAADDYLLWPGGFRVQRIGTGTNTRWHWWGRVVVTYVPVEDTALRMAVQVDLVKLAIAASPGLVGSETIGAWSETFQQTLDANAVERDAILARLSPGPSMVVVG